MLMWHSDEILNACLRLAGRPHVVPMMRFMEMVSHLKNEINVIDSM